MMNMLRSLLSLVVGLTGLALIAQVALALDGRLLAGHAPAAVTPGMGSLLALASQQQVSTVSLSQDRLDEPHRLVLRSQGATRLSGQIQVNGRTVKTLSAGTTTLDLAPYLSAGTTTVTLTADYTPATAQVSVEVVGPDTTLSQQTSGTGELNYQVNLDVR